MTAPELSAREREVLARIESTPAAPESFDATAALRRVMALADECDVEARRHDDAEPLDSDGLTRMIVAARVSRRYAWAIRTAVYGQPS